MLKILFSPSENKKTLPSRQKKELFGSQKAREDILSRYNDIVLGTNEAAIKKLFGFKKFDDCKAYIADINTSDVANAIERYDGVAYDHLDLDSLNEDAKKYLRSNTVIFSNLYGPILGGDTIANYKVKQGEAIGGIAPDKFYKDRFSYQLDLYLSDCDILDLRAGYYDKFYEIKKPYTSLKFLKEGKVVSHWAKAYRGLVLRELARNQTDSIKEFMNLEIEGLSVHEIKVIKNKTEIIYNITDR